MAHLDIPFGAPCWVDLLTSDIDKSKDFYSTLFGWGYQSMERPEFNGYTIASIAGKPVAGLMNNAEDAGHPEQWTTYLRAEDIDEVRAKTEAEGGKIIFPPRDLPGQGRVMLLADPAGAGLGVFEFGGMEGIADTSSPGTPVWQELRTRDFTASTSFLKTVFGWDVSLMSDTDEFRYGTLGEGASAVAGVLDSGTASDGVPSRWQIYFGVADTDHAIEVATDNGGTVFEDPQDSPFGRTAALSDPTGALFRIISVR